MVDRTVKILVETGEISQQQLQIALEEQARTSESLSRILVNKGFITEAKIKDVIELYNFEDINVRSIQISPDVLRMIPIHIIRNNKVFPLKFENNKFVLGMVNPRDLITKDTISLFLGKNIGLLKYKITDQDYFFLLDKYKHFTGDTKDNLHSEENYEGKENESVEKLISRVINSALRKKASQIVIEPSSEHIRIRFKIDNIFYEETRLPRKLYQNFLNHLKKMSGLESEEKSFYYCGNFKFSDSDNKEINIVVNGIKSINGDKLILRPGYPIPDLKKLFYYSELYDYINRITSKNKGLILVIGDSGSGKMTTMYSILQHKISNRNQLMTIEDPIRYIFENFVTQIMVKTERISSLSDLVYEVSQHNPDVIMVQEIKNEEWSALIEELALSGMLVLTSMTAYNSLSALKRLKRMNFPNFASIQSIINQKLVRRLCTHCRVKTTPTSSELHALGYKLEQIPQAYESDPGGCNHCYGGYRGLIGVFEIIKMNREIIHYLQTNQFLGDDLGKLLGVSCIMTFRDYGVRLIADGITSIEELNKIL